MPARNTAARLCPAAGAGRPLQVMKRRAGSAFQLWNLTQIQQLQRTLNLRHAFLAHMQVIRSRRKTGVTQQSLHDRDLNSGLQ